MYETATLFDMPLCPEEGKSQVLTVEKDGVIHARTEYESCYPDKDQRRSMRAAGYKIRLDGRVWSG